MNLPIALGYDTDTNKALAPFHMGHHAELDENIAAGWSGLEPGL
jgi:hypothetical protein